MDSIEDAFWCGFTKAADGGLTGGLSPLFQKDRSTDSGLGEVDLYDVSDSGGADLFSNDNSESDIDFEDVLNPS